MASNNTLTVHGAPTRVEVLVVYKDCMHNHAELSGGFILDGCGLFQAYGANGAPASMFCDVCHCHHNFHRTVEVGLPLSQRQISSSHAPNPVGQQQDGQQTTTGPAPVSSPNPARVGQDMDQPLQLVPVQEAGGQHSIGTGTATRSRKKWITKDKSARLRAIAERNGWKMFKEYTKEEVLQICLDIGIERAALKNWTSTHRRKRAAAIP